MPESQKNLASGRARFLGPAVLLVVLGVALGIGSGLGGGPQTAAQREAGLDTQIRCPSCTDLSVAQSSASSAIAVRNQVAAMVRQGRSNGDIENALVARYGPTILLRPPTSGLTALVWFLPAIAGALAIFGVALLFVRRSRALRELALVEP